MTRAMMILGIAAIGLALICGTASAQLLGSGGAAPRGTPPFVPGTPGPAGGVVPSDISPMSPGFPIPAPTVVVWPFGMGYGYGRSYAHYVVAVKRGYDITWEVFPDSAQAWNRAAALRSEAFSVRDRNAAIERQISQLKTVVSNLRGEMLRADDPSLRPGFEDALGDVQSSIAEKEAQILPSIDGVVAGPFYTDRALNNYLLRVEREAYQVRMKAPAGYTSPIVPAAKKGW
jgi:hypothetical protein